MMTIPRSEIATRDLPDLPQAEMESEWFEAKECFEQARARKQEADREYVAAANRLNMLDRLVKKAEQRAAVTTRAEARSLIAAEKLEASGVPHSG